MNPLPAGPRPHTRLVLAISIDGRLAPPQGGAAQLGGPGDRQVLEEALAWADGALLGAETLRRHGTTCLIRSPRLQAVRRAAGLPGQPVAIVASRRAAFPPDLPFFAQPLQRWLLATPPAGRGVASDPGAGAVQIAGFERRLPLADWPSALAALGGHGIRRLAVLGGARIATALLREGLLDELQLTVCPQLLGGPHLWLAADGLLPPGPWQLLEQRPLQGGEQLLRYGTGAAPAAG